MPCVSGCGCRLILAWFSLLRSLARGVRPCLLGRRCGWWPRLGCIAIEIVSDPAALSRGQQVELAAVGIGHDHDAGIGLAVAQVCGPEGDQTVGLRLLITVAGRSEYEA